MELRVWVDGTQRVVCGVKLTTTCQEIVFALAHATQQAGRFTMIERWRNNERLLSPSEQPMVTLQRWGDHMNEVEFILKKTSTDLPLNKNHAKSSPQQPQQQSPAQPHQNGMPTLSNHPFRASLSTSALSSATNDPSASPSNLSMANMRLHYADDQIICNSPPTSTQSISKLPQNGYTVHNEVRIQPQPSSQQHPIHHHQSQTQQLPRLANSQPQPEQAQVHKNYPYEDLYSTINKKRVNQPPAIPAKPRIVGPIIPHPSFNVSPHQHVQPVTNAQLNYYHPTSSPLSIYSNGYRPRHPPGYLDYMEAVANRNSLMQPIYPNLNYTQTSQHAQSNIYRSFDSQQVYSLQQNGNSPGSVLPNNSYHYPSSTRLNRTSFSLNHDLSQGSSGLQNSTSVLPKIHDSNLVINRGSAVNVKLQPNSHNVSSQLNDLSEKSTSRLNHGDSSSSVSKIGHDMLKVIEEQKRVLINRKNELDKLGNGEDYQESTNNCDQNELITRIGNEIRLLGDLWKENQTQIQKLENQDLEKELQDLKSEQMKMEIELEKQKAELSRCEEDIVLCKTKIEQLEIRIANQESDLDDSSTSSSASSIS